MIKTLILPQALPIVNHDIMKLRATVDYGLGIKISRINLRKIEFFNLTVCHI
jgi:hypothetical protein